MKIEVNLILQVIIRDWRVFKVLFEEKLVEIESFFGPEGVPRDNLCVMLKIDNGGTEMHQHGRRIVGRFQRTILGY